MKKTVLKRCLFGAGFGVALSTMITIMISFCIGDGVFHAVTPALVSECGSEINAVALQFVFSLLYGAAFGGGSVIWETEWSLTKMTVIHFLVISLTALPTAYLMHWAEHSVKGILTYFGIFIAIYAVIWLSTYLSMKKKVKELNAKINK